MAEKGLSGAGSKRRARKAKQVASYVLDSSVLVSSLVSSDEHHSEGARLIEDLLSNSEFTVYTSSIVPVEVSASVARRTRDREIAMLVTEQLAKWIKLGRLKIDYLNLDRMNSASEIATKYFLKGMDAMIVQVAHERRIPIVTFDKEIANRIAPDIKSASYDEIRVSAGK